MFRRSMMVAAALAVFGMVSLASAQEKPYTLSHSGKISVTEGKKGTTAITIKPAEGYHVNRDAKAPMKLTLQGEGLRFKRAILGQGNVRWTKPAKGEAWAVFDVPFTAAKEGQTELQATLKFFVCNASSCLPQSEQVTIPVTVKASAKKLVAKKVRV